MAGGAIVASASGWVSCAKASSDLGFEGFQGFRPGSGSATSAAASSSSLQVPVPRVPFRGSIPRFQFRAFQLRSSSSAGGWTVPLRVAGLRRRSGLLVDGRGVAAVSRVVGRGGSAGRLRFQNLGPVEFDIGVVFFDPADGFFVERGAADLDAWRRAKPVENALPRPPVAAAGIDEGGCFVPAFVAGKPQKWQIYLRLGDRPFFLPGFAAGFFFAALGFVLARGLADRSGGAGAL